MNGGRSGACPGSQGGGNPGGENPGGEKATRAVDRCAPWEPVERHRGPQLQRVSRDSGAV